jgi:hypothetical protein
MGMASLALRPMSAAAAATPEIRHSAESIHQEVILKAEPARVYVALTDGKQFQEVVLLSAAVKSGMVPAATPAEISPEPGGVFSLFGGHLSGRIVELSPVSVPSDTRPSSMLFSAHHVLSKHTLLI